MAGPSRAAFAACRAPTVLAGCPTQASGEAAPPNIGLNSSIPVTPYSAPSIAGAELPLQNPVLDAFAKRYGATVARIKMANGDQGTGFMVAGRVMLTMGHVIGDSDALSPQTDYAEFFYRPGCLVKNIKFESVVNLRREDDDMAVLVTGCHPAFGAPGEAFGRLYLRLWLLCHEDTPLGIDHGHGQRVALIGHPRDGALRVFIRQIREKTWDCTALDDAENCMIFSLDAGVLDEYPDDGLGWSWAGASGAPIIDMDGAVRAMYQGFVWGGPLDGYQRKGVRMDVVARFSPTIRQVVRDQAPRVLGNNLGTNLDAPEEQSQHWGRVVVASMPEAGTTPDRLNAWSIFYLDSNNHVLHLRTDNDSRQRIPNVVHDDVSVMTGLCDIHPAGLIHAWHSLPSNPHEHCTRHLVFATRVSGRRGEVRYVWREPDQRWRTSSLGEIDNLRAPTAGVSQPVAGQGPIPWLFVVADREIRSCFRDQDGRWNWQRVHAVDPANGGRHVEHITGWWCEGGGRPRRGVAAAWVTREPGGAHRLFHSFRDNRDWAGRHEINLGVNYRTIVQTLSLTAADTAEGGDILWHGIDDRGDVVLWLLSRDRGGGWATTNLMAARALGLPSMAAGRARLFRGPDWAGGNRWRQHIWLVDDSRNLGHVWWRQGAWHYQRIRTVYEGEQDPERSQEARRSIAPLFLFDGKTQIGFGGQEAPCGSLLFVSRDNLLWSAFPNDDGDPLLYAPTEGRVELRSVSGASGMPIGWGYVPQGKAAPLLPGEHSGNSCEGVWDTTAGCAARVDAQCNDSSCGCRSRAPCAFTQPAALEQPLAPSPATPQPQQNGGGSPVDGSNNSWIGRRHDGSVAVPDGVRLNSTCDCAGGGPTARECAPCAAASAAQLTSLATRRSAITSRSAQAGVLRSATFDQPTRWSGSTARRPTFPRAMNRTLTD